MYARATYVDLSSSTAEYIPKVSWPAHRHQNNRMDFTKDLPESFLAQLSYLRTRSYRALTRPEVLDAHKTNPMVIELTVDTTDGAARSNGAFAESLRTLLIERVWGFDPFKIRTCFLNSDLGALVVRTRWAGEVLDSIDALSTRIGFLSKYGMWVKEIDRIENRRNERGKKAHVWEFKKVLRAERGEEEKEKARVKREERWRVEEEEEQMEEPEDLWFVQSLAEQKRSKEDRLIKVSTLDTE